MGKHNTSKQNTTKRKIRPASNPDARENQLIALAIDLAEQQLIDGTASSQVISHFLKLATAKERLEREKLEKEVELVKAKTENLQQAKRIEELYAKAINAMKSYKGQTPDFEEDDYDEYED